MRPRGFSEYAHKFRPKLEVHEGRILPGDVLGWAMAMSLPPVTSELAITQSIRTKDFFDDDLPSEDYLLRLTVPTPKSQLPASTDLDGGDYQSQVARSHPQPYDAFDQQVFYSGLSRTEDFLESQEGSLQSPEFSSFESIAYRSSQSEWAQAK